MTGASLRGRRILITRPEPECHDTAGQVAALGGIPLLAPALGVAPPLDPAPFLAAMGRLNTYGGVILTSVNGARAFLQALPPGARVPPVYAVGEKSARLLRKAGLETRVPPEASHGEALARWMATEWTDGGRYLFPRAEEGREELVAHLRQAGWEVERVTAYRAAPMTALPPEIAHRLVRGEVDGITFFSGRSAAAFLALAPRSGWGGAPVVAALSPVTGEALRGLGVEPQVIPAHPTSESLLEALAAHWAEDAD